MKQLNLMMMIACLVNGFPALADDQLKATVVSKEGVGEVAVLGGDKARALKEAEELAVRNAVEQAAGVRIDASTVVVDNQLVRDQIFMNTSGYVKAFTKVSSAVEKDVAKVVVKADIITDNLSKDLGAARDLVKRMGRPKVVILIQEQTTALDGKSIENSEVVASALSAEMKNDGWEIIDEKMLSKSIALEGALTVGPTLLKEIHDKAKVNYVLYGKTLFRQLPGDKSLGLESTFPIAGQFDLTLARSDTAQQIVKLADKFMNQSAGKMLASKSYGQSALGIADGNKERLIEPIRKAIVADFRNQSMNGYTIFLNVSGLEGMTVVKEFQKSLSAVKGVKEVIQDSFDQGKASIRLVSLSATADLGELLEKNNFKGKKIVVTGQTANTLDLVIK